MVQPLASVRNPNNAALDGSSPSISTQEFKDGFLESRGGGDAQMRRTFAATLATVAPAALPRVRALVLELSASLPGR